MPGLNPFGARSTLETAAGRVYFYDLRRLEAEGLGPVSRLPFSIKVLVENLLRNYDGRVVTADHIAAAARWSGSSLPDEEVPFMPARVILQDFTGVPAVVDLAAMRSAVARLGRDPKRINPVIPADLVIDHSVQVDYFGSAYAFLYNVEKEFERNGERYALLRWAQRAFDNFRVVPPGTGIVHQVNLEYLARVVFTAQRDGETVAFPDTLVGTDSHTTMINALGVVGWGVGGIEAEAVMLGQPLYMLLPEVVGVKVYGQLPEGATATDLVLTITQLLRRKNVVGKFVEFFGPGLSQLSIADRATIANMAPEYGATIGFFPVDEETLRYLRMTGRDEALIDLVERYSRAQGLFRTAETPDPTFTDVVELDLGTVEPSVAGPRRPQDRVPLRELKPTFRAVFKDFLPPAAGGNNGQTPEALLQRKVDVSLDGVHGELGHGAVVISAITSCTNTSNPSVMVGAGLLAKKAVERGLTVKPYVKTSLAPGSPVVVDYLEAAGLMPFLEALRFHVVGFGCTTCIGNSGPLPEPVARAVEQNNLVVAAVLSGNRNFEGRINPHCRMAFLASPPLVVAFALAGTVDIDLATEPIGRDPNGEPVYLRDIWPTPEEIQRVISEAVRPEMFRARYARVFTGDERWQNLPVPEGDLFAWDPNSTYVQEPPFFKDFTLEPAPLRDIRGARVLAVLGDSITTDHISPAGSIPVNSPAGQYLISRGVPPQEFNSYGARRGNHEVMIRGTFANIRLRNLLVPGTEGGWTVYHPTGERLTIYEAATRYQQEGTPLLVIAGKEYGAGSSRDWAAKGTMLLGVKAVLAESYERIHRSNLVGMGVLPLQFRPGENRETLGLTGHEVYDIEGIADGLQPRAELTVRAHRPDGGEVVFKAVARVDTPIEVEYYRHGGILPYVIRQMLLSQS